MPVFPAQQPKSMKSYKCSYTGKSKISASLVTQFAPTKAGNFLVENGFDQGNFETFLADFACRAIAAGHDQAKLARAFHQMSAGNASAARQAIADIQIEVEGEKPQSMGAFWGKDPKGGKPLDMSALDV